MKTSIIGRPRRLSRDRRAHPAYTLNCDEPGILYRYRAGIPWWDLPSHFGSWQTVWKHHCRNSANGTWDEVLTALLTRVDAQGLINWEVSVDSTVNRAHQHGTNLSRTTGGPVK